MASRDQIQSSIDRVKRLIIDLQGLQTAVFAYDEFAQESLETHTIHLEDKFIALKRKIRRLSVLQLALRSTTPTKPILLEHLGMPYDPHRQALFSGSNTTLPITPMFASENSLWRYKYGCFWQYDLQGRPIGRLELADILPSYKTKSMYINYIFADYIVAIVLLGTILVCSSTLSPIAELTIEEDASIFCSQYDLLIATSYIRRHSFGGIGGLSEFRSADKDDTEYQSVATGNGSIYAAIRDKIYVSSIYEDHFIVFAEVYTDKIWVTNTALIAHCCINRDWVCYNLDGVLIRRISNIGYLLRVNGGWVHGNQLLRSPTMANTLVIEPCKQYCDRPKEIIGSLAVVRSAECLRSNIGIPLSLPISGRAVWVIGSNCIHILLDYRLIRFTLDGEYVDQINKYSLIGAKPNQYADIISVKASRIVAIHSRADDVCTLHIFRESDLSLLDEITVSYPITFAAVDDEVVYHCSDIPNCITRKSYLDHPRMRTYNWPNQQTVQSLTTAGDDVCIATERGVYFARWPTQPLQQSSIRSLCTADQFIICVSVWGEITIMSLDGSIIEKYNKSIFNLSKTCRGWFYRPANYAVYVEVRDQ